MHSCIHVCIHLHIHPFGHWDMHHNEDVWVWMWGMDVWGWGAAQLDGWIMEVVGLAQHLLMGKLIH